MNKFYGGTFLSPTLSAIFLVLSSSLGLFFSVLQLKVGLWLPCFTLHFCSCAWVIPEDTEKVMRVAPSSCDHNSTNWRGRFSLLRTLVPATSPCHRHRIIWMLVCTGIKERPLPSLRCSLFHPRSPN